VDVALPPETVNEAGLKEMLGPEGDTDPESATVPEKALRLVKLIIAVPVEPDAMLNEFGFDATEKFGVDGAWTMNCPSIDG
jgi:hypothetical protein